MNETFDVPAVVSFVFWVTSVITIAAAIVVVTVKDVFKAAVFLAGSFIGVSVIFFLLNAEFVGVVQILVYVGAISILIAFSVMMIADVSRGSQPSSARYISVTVSALVVAVIAITAYNTDWTLNSDLTDANAIAGLAGEYIEDEIASGEGAVRDASSLVSLPAGVTAKTGVLGDSTGVVGSLLLREFVLPFETVGLVIVAALIGGLALMRPRKDEEEEARGGG